MLKRLINKLKRRKSDSIMKTTRKLIKFKPKRKVNPFLENNTNIRPAKKEAKLIQSLKQNLRKRVMEYKTMNNINVSIKDSSYRAPIDFNSKPKGRFIPVSKPINNCPSTKLP
jgi:gentisate 1,2-dioxygenase